MSVMDKLRRLLGLVDGREDEVAEQVSKRTSVSKDRAKKGINKAQEAVNEDSTNGNDGRNRG